MPKWDWRTSGPASRWSRRLALAFGAALAVIEVAFNWGDPSWWPFIVVDYVAVAMLVGGALWSPRLLSAGWAFAAAMFYMAVFTAAEDQTTPGALLAGMGWMLALTVLGLVLSLVGGRSPDRQPQAEASARTRSDPGTILPRPR